MMGSIVQFLYLICMVAFVVQAEVKYYDFYLREKNFTRLCVTKKMLVVNDQFPGPTIYVNKGDVVFVNVHNHGDYGVTIHWHGVKQPRNPWSDGPEYITQCAIQPGTNFTYEVVFSIEEGTLWWHAHSDWTRNTVHGAIVISPANGTTFPFPTPDAHQVLILGSWYNYDVNLVVEKDLETGADLPESNAYLINGQPGDFCNCSKDSTYRWTVDYGKTYLVKLVNAIMSTDFFFAIAGHNFTIVGMDGEYLKPFVANYVTISPGQTMDILLTANQSLGHYYIAGRQFYTAGITFTDYDKTNVTAILQYNGNHTAPVSPLFPSSLPSYLDIPSGFHFRKKLRSLANKEHPIDVPKNITTRMFITASLNLRDMNQIRKDDIPLSTSLNNITWINPSVDVLQAYYQNISGFYTTDFPDEPPYYFDFVSEDLGFNLSNAMVGTKVKVVEFNEEVEITFQGTEVMYGGVNHPMHLHGHSFYVVGEGFGDFNNETAPATYNLVDPPYLNTASLPREGWLTIRFKANNPGVWLWHCHFDHHFSWGMSTVFIVKNGGTPESTMRDPPPHMPTCDVSSYIAMDNRATES